MNKEHCSSANRRELREKRRRRIVRSQLAPLLVAAGAATVCALPPSAAADTPIPLTDPFPIQSLPTPSDFSGNQTFWGGTGAARAPDGTFVTAWASAAETASGYRDIYMRRVDASGNPVGSATPVSSVPLAANEDRILVSPVLMDAAGNFAIAWFDYSVTFPYGKSVQIRLFTSDGLPRGPDIRLDSPSAPTGGAPRLAMDDAGDFVAAWSNSAGTRGVAHLYNADGTPKSSRTIYLAHEPSAVAMNRATGEFAVASLIQHNLLALPPSTEIASYATYVQRYDAKGRARGLPIRRTGRCISIFVGVQQYGCLIGSPGVLLSDSGEWVLSWLQRNGDGDQIRAQRFKPSNLKDGAPITIASSIPSGDTFWNYSTGNDGSGAFVVVWNYRRDLGPPTINGPVIYGRSVTAGGALNGDPVAISIPSSMVGNVVELHEADYPAVALGPDGHFLTIWEEHLSQTDISDNSILLDRVDVDGRLYSSQ